jgi:ADP-ribosylation factor-binding protein GGA
MDDSLEALLEKATNPKNKYEDWEFIMAFCDRVNLEQEGPQLALRMIVPKMRHENERVNLLALALLEACVKNCGQRFHQELGMFRFLNELIKMLSEKYLGKQTPEVVKAKIKALLYSWKVGLPTEGKIADAYEMLKKEGLAFDESQGPDATLRPEKQKPKVALSQDPKQAKMLQKLLASKNPDDLRAANRLIREMVRRVSPPLCIILPYIWRVSSEALFSSPLCSLHSDPLAQYALSFPIYCEIGIGTV